MKKRILLLLTFICLCFIVQPERVLATELLAETDGGEGGEGEEGEEEVEEFEILNGVLVKYRGEGGAVAIPSEVTTIGASAFSYNKTITSVSVPDGVTSIENQAFYQCTNLESVSLPDSITTFGNSVFSGCAKLATVNIPQNLTTAGYGVFNGTAISSATIPKSFTTCGVNFFGKCANLTTVQFEEGTTTIIANLFNNCTGLKNFTVPDGITTIGEGAFTKCINLKSVHLSDDVKIIRSSAFSSCSELVTINFPKGLEEIHPNAFSSCTSLTQLTIPKSLKTVTSTVESRYFYNCTSLKTIHFEDGITEIPNNLFRSCPNLETITIPETVEIIGDYSFENCASLKEIIIPAKVTTIGRKAFEECTSLTSVKIKSGCTLIKSAAFSGCTSIEVVKIPNTVKEIGDDAFRYCTTLEELHIPPSVTKIGSALASTPANVTIFGMSGSYAETYATRYGYPFVPDANGVMLGENQVLVMVFDEKHGYPIEEAKVSIGGNSYKTNTKGEVIIDVPEEASELKVTKAGYLDWEENSNEYITGKYSVLAIGLHDDAENKLRLKWAKYNETRNLLTSTKAIPLVSQSQGVKNFWNGYFQIKCKAIDTSKVSMYQLVQDGKVIASTSPASLGIGVFTVNVKQFVANKPCFVRVVSTSGDKVDTKINLEIESPLLNSVSTVKFGGDKVSFAVPDNVPGIGGSTVEFALPKELPAEVVVSENKLGILFNIKEIAKSESDNSDSALKETFSNIKKIKRKPIKEAINEAKKYLKNPKDLITPGGEFDISILGYVEYDLTKTTGVVNGEVYVMISATSPRIGFDTVVVVVPVTVYVEGSIETKVGLTVQFDTASGATSLKGVLPLEVGLKPVGAIGFKDAANVGAYGKLKLATESQWEGGVMGRFFLQKADIKGEFGVTARLGDFVWEKPWAHGVWNIYNKASTNSVTVEDTYYSSMYDAENYKVESLNYLSEESEWNGYSVLLLGAEAKTNFISLIEDTYRNAQPVMMERDDVVYAAFLRGDAESGDIYVVTTQMQGGAWREPVRADENAVLDGSPQLLGDDAGNIWLAYTRTVDTTDNPTLLEYAKNQSIVIGKLNPDTMEFTEEKEYITSTSSGYLQMPRLTLNNGVPVLVWTESNVTTDNDVLFATDNKIFMAQYVEDAWSEKTEVCDVNNVVLQLEPGDDGFACVVDMDNDATTLSDNHLVCYDWQGTVQATIEGVNGKVTYEVFPGESGKSYIWNTEGALCNTTNSIIIPGITSDYSLVGDSIYYSTADEDGTELAVIRRNEDGTYGAPIILTEADRYLENLSVVTVSGQDIILGMHTDAEISEASVITKKNLVWSIVQPVNDICIDGIEYEEAGITEGENVTLTITVRNAGDQKIQSINVRVNDSIISTETVDLANGETTELTVNVMCPEDLSEYIISVEDADVGLESDYNTENNYYALKLGYADLAVSAELRQIGITKTVVAELTNEGVSVGSGTIRVYDNTGKVIGYTTFEDLERGKNVIYEFPISSEIEEGSVTLEVIPLQEDADEYNNIASVAIGKTVYEIIYHLDGGVQNESNPAYYYSTDEEIVLADPVKENYKFEGWYTDEAYTTPITSIPTGSMGDLELYAKWGNIPVEGITLNYTELKMKEGEKVQLIATISPENAFDKGVVWTSSNSTVVSVTEDGMIETFQLGNATITATATDGSGVSASCEVSVIIPDKYVITFDGNGATAGSLDNLECEVDESYDLPANVFERPGYRFINWNTKPDGTGVSYENGAKIESLTTTANSTVTLYAQWELVQYTITYILDGGTNTANMPSEYNVTSETITLNEPTKTGYTFEGWYMDESFTTPITSIPTGSTGNIQLYAKWAQILVNKISLNHTKLTINEGLTAQLKATVSPATAFDKEVVWTSSDSSVVTVNENGFIEALKVGSATITVTAKDGSGVKATCTITVIKPVTSIELNATQITFDEEGSTYQLVATVLPNDATIQDLTWTSSDTSVATVSKSGLVTPVKNGSCTITVKSKDGNNVIASCKVVVDIVGRYIVKFDGNGATSGSLKDMECKENESYEVPENPYTRKGYSFIGWNTKADGSGVSYEAGAKIENPTDKTDGVVTLYAQWKKIKYTITYNLNGGTNHEDNMSSYYVTTSTFKLKDPSKKGYTFKGWYSDSEFTKKVTEIKKGSTGNKTFYAKWSRVTYTITYVLNGGTNHEDNKTSYNVSSSTFTLKKPTRKGYTFKGWYSDSEFKKEVTEIKKGSTGNVTLYAKWSKNKYTITYNLDGGTNSSKNPDSYYVTTSTITLANPTKAGFTFKGWYTDSKFTKGISAIKKGSTGNIELYAKWTAIKYTIKYDLDGGKNDSKNPSSYYVTTSTITLKNPTKTGYIFKGWYLDASYKDKVSQIKKGSTGNVKLYAKWSAIKYTIKFSGNGSTSGSMKKMDDCQYGKSYKLDENAFKNKGYKFVGWNTKKDGKGKSYKDMASVKNLVTEDGETIVLYAQWEKIKYTITYNLNGGTNHSNNPKSYNVTTSTITLKSPTRKGYTFKGWYSDSNFKTKVTQIKKGSTGNMKLYAKWSKK